MHDALLYSCIHDGSQFVMLTHFRDPNSNPDSNPDPDPDPDPDPFTLLPFYPFTRTLTLT